MSKLDLISLGKNRKTRLISLLSLALLLGCLLFSPKLVFAQTSTDDDPCAQYSGESSGGRATFNDAIFSAHDENQKAKIAATQKIFRDMKYKDKMGCILQILTYFESVHNILVGIVSLVAGIILGIVNAILGKICEFIITGINNLLSMICLPVPNLGFSLSLPSLERQTCDGISLGNFISVGGGYSGYYGSSFPGTANPMMIMEPKRAKKTTIPVF